MQGKRKVALTIRLAFYLKGFSQPFGPGNSVTLDRFCMILLLCLSFGCYLMLVPSLWVTPALWRPANRVCLSKKTPWFFSQRQRDKERKSAEPTVSVPECCRTHRACQILYRAIKYFTDSTFFLLGARWVGHFRWVLTICLTEWSVFKPWIICIWCWINPCFLARGYPLPLRLVKASQSQGIFVS